MRCFLTIVCVAILVSSSLAQIPQLINYQGFLADSTGTPVNGSLSMVFSIYDDSTGGVPVWMESHGSVSVFEGRFNVLLGSINPLEASVFDESDRYLGLAVNGDPEMQPRARISSTPYTYNAGSVASSSGGSVLLVGSASDTVQVDPYSGYAFRVTNDSGDERLIIEANDEEGSTISIKNPNGRYMTLGSGDSTVCIYGMDGGERVIIGMEAGDRIDGGGAVSVYDDSTRLAVSVSREGVVLFNGNARSDTMAIYSTDGNIRGQGWISMGTDSLNGPWSAVFGQNCSGNGTGSAVSGGISNHANGFASAIGGGSNNVASAAYSGVFSGYSNLAGDGDTDTAAFIGGGYANIADAKYATVGGGIGNTATYFASVGGGYYNTAGRDGAVVCGGANNDVSGFGLYASIGGGHSNNVSDGYGTIGGGYQNTADGFISTVGGGYSNTAIGEYSTIGGGDSNIASGPNSTVGGGLANTASEYYSTVGGGGYNKAHGWYSVVGGGGGASAADSNSAIGDHSTIGGGARNMANATYATIGAGYLNSAVEYGSTIGGGVSSSAGGYYSTVAGGWANTSAGYGSMIGGGQDNSVGGDYSTVAGGIANYNQGDYSVIPGGYYDTLTATADFSMVYGVTAYVNSSYRVAFFDGDVSCRFGINRDDHDGGINYPLHIGTGTGNGNGAYLTAGGVWTNGSSRTFNGNFQTLNSNELLLKISALPVGSWQFIDSDERHVGPYAEDFVAAFDVGTIREDDGKRDNRYVAACDVAGVALAGVQALLERIEELEKEIAELKANQK